MTVTVSVSGLKSELKDKIIPERRQLLWDVLSDKWEDGFAYLKAYSHREGHSRVQKRCKTDDSYRLGSLG